MQIKKISTFIIAILLCGALEAQIKMNKDGNVRIGSGNPTTHDNLSTTTFRANHIRGVNTISVDGNCSGSKLRVSALNQTATIKRYKTIPPQGDIF